MAAEFHGHLQVSVDGVDCIDDLGAWMAERVDGDVSSFGEQLLKWVDAQRVADEEKFGSADGVVAPVGFTLAAGVALTGNAAWKARLQAGETVQFRGGGNSLAPRIRSGECCKYSPVLKHEDIKVKDIVFCQINGRYWGHMVKKKTFVGGDDMYEYTISNIRGFEHGTCKLDHNYGKNIDHWM